MTTFYPGSSARGKGDGLPGSRGPRLPLLGVLHSLLSGRPERFQLLPTGTRHRPAGMLPSSSPPHPDRRDRRISDTGHCSSAAVLARSKCPVVPDPHRPYGRGLRIRASPARAHPAEPSAAMKSSLGRREQASERSLAPWVALSSNKEIPGPIRPAVDTGGFVLYAVRV